MMDNLSLFELSLKNPEPFLDSFYLKEGNLIISKNPKDLTSLMRNNLDLLESITAYSFALKNNNKQLCEEVASKVLEIIKTKNINYSEFVSFWSILDISYSLFNKMDEAQKKIMLKDIIEKYITLRHDLYSIYGYTPVTLQVGKDAKAHKESGSLGIKKVGDILDKLGYKKTNSGTIENFLKVGDKNYLEADKKGKKLFKEIMVQLGVKFSWSSGKEGKMPDVFIRHKNDIFIVEHKHMKEGGGGQDKQVNEVVSFISFSEDDKKIHYVSFLDGVYFNLLSNQKNLNKGKITNQIAAIKQNLKENQQNYFVNTAGFKELIKNLS